MGVQRKVFVTRRVPKPGIEVLEEAGCDVSFWDSDEAIPKEELIRGIAGVHALFCMLTDVIDGEVLDAAGINYIHFCYFTNRPQYDFTEERRQRHLLYFC